MSIQAEENGPARSDSFSYNGRNELTAAPPGRRPYGYSYDNIGNRKRTQEITEELTYTTNGLNQYTSIVYNAANRTVSFTSQKGNTLIPYLIFSYSYRISRLFFLIFLLAPSIRENHRTDVSWGFFYWQQNRLFCFYGILRKARPLL